jgi:protein SCO1/2
MRSSRSCLLRALAALACAVALPFVAGCSLVALGAAHQGPITQQPGHWIDEAGNPVVFSGLAGEPFVLTAVFTGCSLRCPLTIDKLREVDAAFRRHGATVPIRLLTLDPSNDTPERLRRFKEERHLPDNWHFLRGSREDTRSLARYLRVNAAYDDGHIDHDVRIAVFDGQGRLAKSFSSWSFRADEAVVAP